MAASRCTNVVHKLAGNVWLLRPNTVTSKQLSCRNSIAPHSLIQSARRCSSFTIKAEQMDGNYRLKKRSSTTTSSNGDDEDEIAKLIEDVDRLNQQPKIPPPYMQRRNRYYQSRAYMAKKYQWEGKASGIDPAIMWPTKAELGRLKTFEKEWEPSLEQLKEELEAERKQRRLEELKREKIIAANMAKMPQWLKEFDDKIEEEKLKEKKQKEKRAKLLEEARVKLGYHVDHRSKYFKTMLEDMELEEKKRRKEEKKKARRAKLGMAKPDAE